MKRLLVLGLPVAALILTSGCMTSSGLAERAAEFERLGITEATIVGKFSATEYHVTREPDGTRRATFEHSNAWLPKVRIVRDAPPQPPSPSSPDR